MSQNFTLLWEKILRSSLWVIESKETRLVWITILAMKNSDGQVFSSVVGLADAAKVTLEECKAALEVLMAPDPNDTSKVDEGRRIRAIAGGWQVVNHDLYRFSTDEKRAYWAEKKADQRKREKERLEKIGKPAPKARPSPPLKGEQEYLRRESNGASEEELDQTVTNHLPEGAQKSESIPESPHPVEPPSTMPELE